MFQRSLSIFSLYVYVQTYGEKGPKNLVLRVVMQWKSNKICCRVPFIIFKCGNGHLELRYFWECLYNNVKCKFRILLVWILSTAFKEFFTKMSLLSRDPFSVSYFVINSYETCWFLQFIFGLVRVQQTNKPILSIVFHYRTLPN